MSFSIIDKKKDVQKYLLRNPFLYLYCLGDLDDFFYPQTSWVGRYDGEQISALFLIYQTGNIPVLIALEDHNHEACLELMAAIAPALPNRLQAQLSPALASSLSRHFQLEHQGTYHRMSLVNDAYKNFVPPNDLEYRPLTTADLPFIERLYHKSYPANWFDARLLSTGKYVGLFDPQELISIAGIHVYSAEFKVAALGGVATHPNHRKRGHALTTTALLCQDLSLTTQYIGLNVDVTNIPAQSCYRQLGFVNHSVFEEYAASRR